METFLEGLGAAILFIGLGIMWCLIIWASSDFPKFWKSKE